MPLVGFDLEGYRLGYRGGYYDRTLTAMAPRPSTIGVGFELGRLATIHPQPHDALMDAIVTEEAILDAAAPRTGMDEPDGYAYASPPCLLHELDAADRDRKAGVGDVEDAWHCG